MTLLRGLGQLLPGGDGARGSAGVTPAESARRQGRGGGTRAEVGRSFSPHD